MKNPRLKILSSHCLFMDALIGALRLQKPWDEKRLMLTGKVWRIRIWVADEGATFQFVGRKKRGPVCCAWCSVIGENIGLGSISSSLFQDYLDKSHFEHCCCCYANGLYVVFYAPKKEFTIWHLSHHIIHFASFASIYECYFEIVIDLADSCSTSKFHVFPDFKCILYSYKMGTYTSSKRLFHSRNVFLAKNSKADNKLNFLKIFGREW